MYFTYTATPLRGPTQVKWPRKLSIWHRSPSSSPGWSHSYCRQSISLWSRAGSLLTLSKCRRRELTLREESLRPAAFGFIQLHGFLLMETWAIVLVSDPSCPWQWAVPGWWALTTSTTRDEASGLLLALLLQFSPALPCQWWTNTLPSCNAWQSLLPRLQTMLPHSTRSCAWWQ